MHDILSGKEIVALMVITAIVAYLWIHPIGAKLPRYRLGVSVFVGIIIWLQLSEIIYTVRYAFAHVIN